MDSKTIFSKTAKGLNEVSGDSSDLPRAMRAILKEIDGKSSLADLQAKLRRLSETELIKALMSMSDSGHIRETNSTSPATSAASPPTAASTPSASVEDGGFGDLDFTALAPAPKPASAPPPPNSKVSEKEAKQAAETKARLEAEQKAKAQAEEKARQAVLLKAKQEAEQKAREEALAKAKLDAEEKQRQAMLAKAKQEAEAKARAEAEAKARQETETRLKKEAEEKLRHEAEEKAKREAEERTKQAALAQAKREAEEKARQEAALRLKLEVAARLKREAEELAAREAEARARKDAELKAQQEVEAKRRREAEEKAQREAELKAKAEAQRLCEAAESQMKREAEAKARQEAEKAEELARREAEERAQREAEEKARREAELLAQRELEAQRLAEAQRARDEAEARAKQEAEASAVEEAEQKAAARKQAEAAAEQQARREAEAAAEQQARHDAEEKKRLAAWELTKRRSEEKLKQEVEEKARREAEDRLKIETRERAERKEEERLKEALKDRARQEAEAKAQQEKQERIRKTAEEELREEAKEKSKREAEAQAARIAEEKTADKRARAANRPQIKWGKLVTLVSIPLVAIALGIVHFMPFNGRIPDLERLASEQFQQPVKIDSVHLSLFPPHWRLDGVSVGDAAQIKAPQVKAEVDVGGLFGATTAFKSVEFKSPVIKEEAVAWLLFGKPQSARLQMAQIKATDAVLDSSSITLPHFEARADIGAEGGWQKLILEFGNKEVYLELHPDADGAKFDMNATTFVPPFGGKMQLDDFTAKGSIKRQEIVVSEFAGRSLGGGFTGNAILKVGDGWSINGIVSAKQVSTREVAPALISGHIDGKAALSAQTQDGRSLLAAPHLEGSFSIDQGSVLGVDAMHLLSGSENSEKTGFRKLSGSFVHDNNVTHFRQIQLDAGILSVVGSADVQADGDLRGRFTAVYQFDNQRTSGNLSLSGTVQAPKFSR